jgi:hypothetical protein
MPSLLNESWEHASSCVPTVFVLALTSASHLRTSRVKRTSGQHLYKCAAPTTLSPSTNNSSYKSGERGSTNNGSLSASRTASFWTSHWVTNTVDTQLGERENSIVHLWSIYTNRHTWTNKQHYFKYTLRSWPRYTGTSRIADMTLMRWAVSFQPWPLYPHCRGGGPHSRSGHFEEEIVFLWVMSFTHKNAAAVHSMGSPLHPRENI